MAKIKYVIVQAGGRGSRMERLTRNKPKALVPVGNQPMLLRLFKTFRRLPVHRNRRMEG